MRVTIKDIAKAAKVTPTTVSRVINKRDKGISENKRKEIENLIETMGYIPNINARNLVTNQSKTIGVLLPDIVMPYFPEIARGIQDAALEKNYNVILMNTDAIYEKELEAIKLLKTNGVEGILYCVSNLHIESSRTEDLRDKTGEIPFIVIGCDYSDKKITSIYPNSYESIKDTTSSFVQQGIKNFVYVAGMTLNENINDGLRGFKEAINNSFEYSLCLGHFNLKKTEIEIEKHVKNLKEKTLFICECDLMAVGVLNCLKKNKIKIPDKALIISYDNTVFSKITTPKISVISIPRYDLGYKGFNLLIEILKEKTKNISKNKCTCNYIKRETT